MSLKPKLHIEPCVFKAAKFAVMNWHYSKVMPAGKLVKYGVWEDNKFIGVVIFGRGANNNLAKSFKLQQTECCELVRIALTTHQSPVTQIVAVCLKLLKRDNPGLILVASYADETNQNHKGIIYKAGNWKYLGVRIATSGPIIFNGKLIHNRSVSSKFGSKNNIPESLKAQFLKPPPQKKHLFVYSLRKSYNVSIPTNPGGERQFNSDPSAPQKLAQISKVLQ